MSIREKYEEAQKLLELEASKNNFFYHRGMAFTEDRKQCIIVEIAWRSEKVYYSLINHNTCVACDADLDIIFKRTRIHHGSS